MKVDLYALTLHVALVALCAVTFLLAMENRRLKTERVPALDGGPEVGQKVDAIRWMPLDGEPATIDFGSGDRDRFLLVFTTDCPACLENQSAWRSLSDDLGDSADLVGISLSGLPATLAYRDSLSLSYPVGLVENPGELTRALTIEGVPMTIHVGTDGRVRRYWSGALSDDQLSEVIAAGRG